MVSSSDVWMVSSSQIGCGVFRVQLHNAFFLIIQIFCILMCGLWTVWISASVFAVHDLYKIYRVRQHTRTKISTSCIHTFTSSHLHIYTSSHLHTFTSAHLHMYICKQSQVGGGWGGGGVVDVSCGTMIILHFSRHRPRFARDLGWVAWKSAAGPSPLFWA